MPQPHPMSRPLRAEKGRHLFGPDLSSPTTPPPFLPHEPQMGHSGFGLAAEPLISPLVVKEGNTVLKGFDEKGVSLLDFPEDLVQLLNQGLDDSCRKAIHNLPGHWAVKDDQDVHIALLGKIPPGEGAKEQDE